MPSPFDDLFVPPRPVGAGITPAAAAARGGSPFDDVSFAPDALVGTGPAPIASAVPSVATPPIVPAPPRPPMIQFQQPSQPRTPNFLSMALPMIASALIGGKDPRAVAEGLAAFMQGRELRRAERESLEDRVLRRRQEQAEFYSRAIAQAQTFDDPIAFEQWKNAIAPVAQVHGVDPEAFTFNDQKLAARTKKEAADLLEALDKQHPDGNYTALWKDPKTGVERRLTRAELARVAGAAAFDAQGKALAPTNKPANPRALQAKNITVNGQRRTANYDPDGGKFYDQQGNLIPDAVLHDDPAGKGTLEQQLLDAMEKGDKAAEQRIRTAMNARDVNMSGRSGPSDYQQFGMGERLAATWTKANAPVKEMDRQLRIMEAGMKRFRSGDKNGGSQAVLVTFQKILDPTSVVRESEYARTTDGQALLDRIEGYVTKLGQGGANLTDREMAAMVATARQMLDGMRSWNAGTRQRIERVAKQNGIPLENVFDDLLTGDVGAPAPGRGNVTIKSITEVK